MILTILLLIYPLLFYHLGNTITINVLVQSEERIHSLLTKDFNKFSKENGLNITLHLNLLTPQNMSYTVNNYQSMIENLLYKKSKKYDLIVFDNIYSKKFESYFLDLKDLLPQEHLDLYSEGIAAQTCIFNNKWVALPVTPLYSVLYSNMNYLNKYKKNIPKTWDELMETSKYIINEEKRLNNTSIVGYNGGFHNIEFGTCSLYEFIYSCRDSYESPFPDLLSNTTINALHQLKKIKNEISSDDYFRYTNNEVLSLLNEGNFVFIKFWDLYDFPNYKKTALPGIKPGLSGTVIGGNNIGIVKHISEERKKISLQVLSYITSRDVHKKFVMEKVIFSSIPSFYYDDEVCSVLDCEFYRGFQPIARPTWMIEKNEWNVYSLKFRTYIYEFLYGNKTAEESLRKVVNILKVHSISFITDDNDNNLGKIIFIILSVIFCIIIFSLIIPRIKLFSMYFKIFSYDFWIIHLVGSIILLFLCLMEFGEITSIKCKVKQAVLLLGNSLNLFPFIYELFIYFPEDIKESEYFNHHRFLIISIYNFTNIVLIILSFFVPISAYELYDPDDRKFKTCRINSTQGIVMKESIYIINILNMLIMLFIIFKEWNIQETFVEIKLLASSIYTEVLLYIMILIFDYIKINQYTTYFIIYEILALLNRNKNNESVFFIDGCGDEIKNGSTSYKNNIILQYILKYHNKQLNEEKQNESITTSKIAQNITSNISIF
ncbi:periplasmic binding protein-like II [Neocallimastix californiae]|uniref:Periplasmic binding protein-like II n=1 Tax=Neocallimastix californiae TaxID=1754190 RepID=A0A1Y2C7F1_9FUNG|nr:periplasmic binding protein-like II [Neocallimastix californiae]|eukprot:ORY42952.1 periplasmic binding protein-like II [Neocallimastix californiae]